MLSPQRPRRFHFLLRNGFGFRFVEQRIVNGQVVLDFVELDADLHVIRDEDGEGNFDAVYFAVIVVIFRALQLASAVALFGAQQQAARGV